MTTAKAEKVITYCYGKKREFESRKDAMEFFIACLMNSEGAEADRYGKVLKDIADGFEICRDGSGDEVWREGYDDNRNDR